MVEQVRGTYMGRMRVQVCGHEGKGGRERVTRVSTACLGARPALPRHNKSNQQPTQVIAMNICPAPRRPPPTQHAPSLVELRCCTLRRLVDPGSFGRSHMSHM